MFQSQCCIVGQAGQSARTGLASIYMRRRFVPSGGQIVYCQECQPAGIATSSPITRTLKDVLQGRLCLAPPSCKALQAPSHSASSTRTSFQARLPPVAGRVLPRSNQEVNSCSPISRRRSTRLGEPSHSSRAKRQGPLAERRCCGKCQLPRCVWRRRRGPNKEGASPYYTASREELAPPW